jgi:hypothetical protein
MQADKYEECLREMRKQEEIYKKVNCMQGSIKENISLNISNVQGGDQ